VDRVQRVAIAGRRRPTSTGTIRVRDAHPTSRPRIQHNYLVDRPRQTRFDAGVSFTSRPPMSHSVT
jgi:hypothetical protein